MQHSAYLPRSLILTKGLRNRHVLAARAFQPGETIAVFSGEEDKESSSSSSTSSTETAAGEAAEFAGRAPCIVITDTPSLSQTCSYCLESSSSSSPDGSKPLLRACTGCRAAHYCSSTCQKADWGGSGSVGGGAHKAECKAFRRVRQKQGGRDLPTPVRAMVQALGRPGVLEAMDGLEGHVDGFRRGGGGEGSSLGGASPTATRFEDLEIQALGALKFLGRELEPEGLARALDVACKLSVNSFSRTDEDVDQYGLFFHPGLAMLNHSCVPNAFVQCVGRKAVVYAYRKIEKDEEVEISYIEPTTPRDHRRQSLRERYHFECSCPRCDQDLSVYEVCASYPHLQLNKFSLVRDPDALAKGHPMSRQKEVSELFESCRRISDQGIGFETSGQSAAGLAKRWKICAPLRIAGAYAIDPLHQVLVDATVYFLSQDDGNLDHFAYALAIACFAAIRSQPYRSPMPFAPQRIRGLLMVAKLLSNTAEIVMSDARPKGANATAQKTWKMLGEIDQVTLCEMLLTMVLRYDTSSSASTSPVVFRQARDLLGDIRKLPGREKDSALIKAFLRHPSGDEESRFFEFAVLDPMNRIADLAIEIVGREFGS